MEAKKFNIKLLLINVALLVISIVICKYIYEVEINKQIYAEESVKFIEENINPVFAIEKIDLWSSAYAIDNSNGDLKDINISQFTDIVVYIDNKGRSEEITAENTVNQMFIDNIKVKSESKNGEKIFNYKNPYNFGKYSELNTWVADGILFNIINTNEKNISADYNDNAFFTDCSNPISLGYINKDILKNCEVTSNEGTLTFDGSILKNANVNLEELKTNISFVVHIINNYNEAFACDVSFDIDLTQNNNAIHTGFAKAEIVPQSNEFNFVKVEN